MTEQNRHSMLLGKIEAYREILDENQDSPVFVSLAETYRQLGMFSSAQKVLAEGLKKFPRMASAHVVSARVCCQLEDYVGSESAFESALESDSGNLAALVGYARVKILQNQHEAARRLLIQARNLNPADPVINKLILSLPEEKPTLAVTPSRSVISEPVSPQPVTRKPLISTTLGDLYFKQGLYENALKIYRGLLDQAPDSDLLQEKISQTEKELVGVQQLTTVENLVVKSAATEVDESSDLVSSEPSPALVAAEVAPPVDTLKVDKFQFEVTAVESADLVAEMAHLHETDIPQASVYSAVDILNQWLKNIQQRRQHV